MPVVLPEAVPRRMTAEAPAPVQPPRRSASIQQPPKEVVASRPPRILMHPEASTVDAGADATLYVTADVSAGNLTHDHAVSALADQGKAIQMM